MTRPFHIWISLCTLIFFSCKKESFIKGSGAWIEVSADSLHFDTLFTGAGSVTQSFKLYNRNNQKLLVSKISLGGGNASYFRINADGFEGPEVKNLEMEANDSLYVFITVKIGESSGGLPFIVQDSVEVVFNGNVQAVQLDAWGQNANFLRSQVISSNTTWTNDRPYVILGSLRVDENAVLTIEKGTKIYLHNDAPFLVDGTLKVNGEKTDSMEVVFSGDRLDYPYSTYPGAWPGIYFREKSKANVLKHAIVQNANQGIVVEGPPVGSDRKLVLDKCIVRNCYDAGIIGTQTSLEAINCLVANCGKNIQLLGGGNYLMVQCTVAAYSNPLITHNDPVLTVNNYLPEGSGVASHDLDADFTNCIFWGDNGIVEDEVVAQQQGAGAFNVLFENCLWKMKNDPPGVISSNVLANQDPLFLNIDTRNNVYDFHPGEDSPALNAGMPAGVTTDLDENSRDPIFPDLGAYEATF